jgi:SAM-dependent methyltransferase
VAVDVDHVTRTYDDAYFNAGGAGYPDYLAEGDLLRERGRWYARQVACFMPVGAVLDVGAAAGFLLKGFEDLGWRGEGIEPNATMARHAREALGLSVAAAQLENFDTDRRFGLVTMIQVVAHLEDPRNSVARVAGLLGRGGHLLIETWNCRSLTARLLGSRWHEYSPPSVLHCFSARSLVVLAGGTGFRVVARGRPSKRISAGHAKALLRYKYGEHFLVSGLLRSVPDRAQLPYPSEDLVWLLLRKA